MICVTSRRLAMSSGEEGMNAETVFNDVEAGLLLDGVVTTFPKGENDCRSD